MSKTKAYNRIRKELLGRRFIVKVASIYCITCLENQKIYIGSSANTDLRWDMHKLDLEYKKHHNYKLQMDFNEFGIKAFRFEIIEHFPSDIKRSDLFLIEQGYIDRHNPEYNVNRRVDYGPPGKKKKLFGKHRKMKKHKLHAA